MKLTSLISASLPLLSAVLGDNVPGAVNGTTSHYIKVRGQTYHYLNAYPADNSTSKGNILLFHGLPDFSYGWHLQIPFLASLGYRVIAPDMLGAARTDAPCPIARYTFKEMTADIAELVDEVLGPDAQVIVGGHDWGTGVAYKFPLWYPEKTKALFGLSYPYVQRYFGPNTEWVDLEELVRNGTYPTYGYQLQWRDISFDRNFTSKDEIRTLLNGLIGGTTADGRYAISAEEGILYDVLPEVVLESGLLKGADLDTQVDAISINGVRGGWNWYRTRRMNYEDELEIARSGGFRYELPALFIPSLGDITVLPRYYEEDMRASFDDLTIKPLNTSHWVLLEDPQGVNRILEGWLAGLA